MFINQFFVKDYSCIFVSAHRVWGNGDKYEKEIYINDNNTVNSWSVYRIRA